MDTKSRILFIINPISGIGKQKKVEAVIEESLNKAVFDYKIAYTEYAHHATEICKNIALKKDFDIIAVVGGDGSINDCVKGLAGTDISLAIVPAGSGNGFARTLKIPLNLNNAIEVINEQKRICIDTVSLNDICYVSIAGIGFDALVAKEFAKVRTRGFHSYFQIVATHYPLYRSSKYSLEIDGEKIERKALFICFANANQFGYNTVIAPSSKLTDGFMDVICVQKIPIPFLPFVASLLFTKLFEQSTYVKSYKAKEVKVFSNNVIPVNIDGEYIEVEGDLHVKIFERNLNVIIP
ncbi:MAG: diacylglycerol kinase family lipid kinase [Bacteroidales bacterium]|jgi:YegS/Rv2252/BmrU family lipid kinase|nr:diacylglycerol kinase family lipid kinase [Bacteroidales bacterium]